MRKEIGHTILNDFVLQSAPMAINIPGTMRVEIEEAFKSGVS
jgi:hypothetical protein